jgi:membrane protease YdiL (CAAX protease family)
MPLRVAVVYFGVPTAFVILVVWGIMPRLAERGVPSFVNYVVVYASIPMLLLIAASLVAFRAETGERSWAALKRRFRLAPMDRRAWLWTLGLVIFMVGTAGALSFTARALASVPLLAPPDFWPAELNPAMREGPAGIPSEFMGMTLAGNWWILGALLVSLVIATLGEELWWRGYILPRQELSHGGTTWIIHGTMWALFHIFAPWNLLVILPGCLALSWVAQRLKNTWPAVIAHGLANGLLVLAVVFLGVLGK